MGEMVERRSSLGTCRKAALRDASVLCAVMRRGRFDLESRVGEVEEMTLAGIVVEAFAAGAEDIEAKQG